MIPLVVVENPRRWTFDVEGVEVVPARRYLVDPGYADRRRVAVYNVCRNYGYQSVGYYVSLLAEARGHRPLPSVETLQALGDTPLVRLASQEVDDLVQKGLGPLKSDEFRLSIYFGRNVARRYDRLSRAFFNAFPAPFLSARFVRGDRWKLVSLRPLAAGDVPEAHRDFALEQARQFFARPGRVRRPREYRWELAVLWSPDDPSAPSDERAIRRLTRAAESRGIKADLITPDDVGRIAEYDALFLRETTAVNHHTYRIARRAAAEGLVVLDRPESIVRCGNKVYQAELFERHAIPCPRTLVVHEGNVDEVADAVGLPCVLKRPDGAFSRGVQRVESAEELRRVVPDLFRESELLVAQSFVSSSFDWRVGVLDGAALFVCRYHMARGHWQIARTDGGRTEYGPVDTLALHEAPARAVELAVRAATLVGDGLYGVDVKEVGGRFLVMEINDNPNLDSGVEDSVAGDALWDALVDWFAVRLDARGANGTSARRR